MTRLTSDLIAFKGDFSFKVQRDPTLNFPHLKSNFKAGLDFKFLEHTSLKSTFKGPL
jgi:hypothetical protein